MILMIIKKVIIKKCIQNNFSLFFLAELFFIPGKKDSVKKIKKMNQIQSYVLTVIIGRSVRLLFCNELTMGSRYRKFYLKFL
jgi:hypothetical protein